MLSGTPVNYRVKQIPTQINTLYDRYLSLGPISFIKRISPGHKIQNPILDLFRVTGFWAN